MAKKQRMNLFEAHLEKIAIGASILVFLWVLVTRFVLVTGIETSNGVQPVIEIVKDKADEAKEIWDRTKSNGVSPVLVPPPKNPTEDVAFLASSVDTLPLGPINTTQVEADAIHEKIANFPKAIISPHSLSIAIYHTRASLESTETSYDGDEELQDIDFVTVEGMFSMEQVRSLYRQSFQNPSLKHPVEYPKPIVAAVELQRSQLLPDGRWSAWQRISRLDVDPEGISDLASEEFTDYSLEKYKAILNVRSNALVQKRILQPVPYSLLDDEWLPPTEQAKRKKEESKMLRGPAGRPGFGPGGFGAGSQRPKRDSDVEREEIIEEDLEEYVPRGTGRSSTRRGYTTSGRQRGSVRSPEREEAETYLQEEELSFWTHDQSVVPGVTYRYQVRVGFFNPIAGTDRFLPGDISKKNKLILWSAFSSNQAGEHKFVKVNKRVCFFPLQARSGDKAIATVEVFRQHEGQWYRRTYPVIPGSTVGAMDLPEKSASNLRKPPGTTATTSTEPEPEPEKIDFRTGVTIVDITPETAHWYSSGSSSTRKEESTPDLVYRDVDGFMKSVPVNRSCWPQELRQQRDYIMKKRREAKAQFRARPSR